MTLNVKFDSAIASFATSPRNLKDLYITQGVFAGWTVGKLLDEANKKIGGCSSSPYSFSQFNDAADKINNSYDGGSITNNYLGCKPIVKCTTTQPSCYGGSNGTATLTVTCGFGPYKYGWANGQLTQTITGLSAGNYKAAVYDSTYKIGRAHV